MSNPLVYELLLRHQPLLTPDSCLLGNGHTLPANWLPQLKATNTRIVCWDWQTRQAYQSLPDNQVMFDLPQTHHLAPEVTLLWPKSKQLGLQLVSLIANSCQSCYVAAANDAGGKSIGNACEPLVISANKVDSARRCSLWQLHLTPGDSFNWLQAAQSFQWRQRNFMTLPGVFNHGQLDAGTQLLLESLPSIPAGNVLDLGCGCGVIGLSLKASNPEVHVTLTDVDAIALHTARLNAMRLGIDAVIDASDGFEAISGTFDHIVSNPPFHQGKETDYEFARQLFSQAQKHLHPSGSLWIVANQHLPYENWATLCFHQVEPMQQQQGYKILRMSNAR